MALENVVEEILSQAENESKEIISRGEADAKVILDAARKQAREKASAFDEETGMLAEEMEKTEFSSLNIAFNRQMLEVKKQAIDSLFAQVMQKVSEMSSSERSRLVDSMLEKADKELGSIGVVWCSDEDKGIVSKKGYNVKLLDTVGGIIAENKDGSVRSNYTFEVLLNRMKEEMLNEVAKKIFEY